MTGVKLNGRAGGPAMTAAEMLASAFMRAGRHVRAFPSPEIPRPWAPLAAFLLVDDEAIRDRSAPIEFDHLVFFDSVLAERPGSLEGLKSSGWILLDEAGRDAPGSGGSALEGLRTATIDTSRIAGLCGGNDRGAAIRAAAMAGAFARATGLLSLDELCGSIEESRSEESAGQISAARVAYEEVSLKP